MNPSELKKFVDAETKSDPPNVLSKNEVEEFIQRNVNKVLKARIALNLRHSLSSFFVVQLQGDSPQIPRILGTIWNHPEALSKEIHLESIDFLSNKVLLGSRDRGQKAHASNVLKRTVEVIHMIYDVMGAKAGEEFVHLFSESLILKGTDNTSTTLPMKHCVRVLKSLIEMSTDPGYHGAFSVVCEIVSWAFSKPQGGDQKKMMKSIHVLGEMAKYLVDPNAPRANTWENAQTARAASGHARRYIELKYRLVVPTAAAKAKQAIKGGGEKDQFVTEASKLVQHVATVSARRVIEWCSNNNGNEKLLECALASWPPAFSPPVKMLMDGSKPGCLGQVLRQSADWFLRQYAKGSSTKSVPPGMKFRVLKLCTHPHWKVRKEACSFLERLHPTIISDMSTEEWIQLTLGFPSTGGTSDKGEMLNKDLNARIVEDHPLMLEALARLDVQQLINFMDAHPYKSIVSALLSALFEPTRHEKAEDIAQHFCEHKDMKSIRALDMILNAGALLSWTNVFPHMFLLITKVEIETARATLKVLRKIFLTSTAWPQDFDPIEFVICLGNSLRKSRQLNDISIIRRTIQLFCTVNEKYCVNENENNESYAKRLLATTQEGSNRVILEGESLQRGDKVVSDAFSLACHMEMGPVNKKYLLEALRLMHSLFKSTNDDVREDVLLVQLQLLRSLKLNPPTDTQVGAPLAKKVFSHFVETDLKYAFEKKFTSALPAACQLMRRAVKDGDGIKVEVLSGVAKFVSEMLKNNRVEVIKFLGALVQRGVISPSDFSFDGTLIAVMIGDLVNSDMALKYLKGMQAHHVASGFLAGRDKARELLKPITGRKYDKKRVEQIVNLLSSFDSAGRSIIGSAMLNCIKVAAGEIEMDATYLIILATAMSNLLLNWPDSLVERWCSNLTSSCPETRTTRILQASAFWMCQQRSNKASLSDTITAAESLESLDDIKAWWSDMRFEVLDFDAPAKKRIRVSLASTAAPELDDIGVLP